MSIFGNIMAKVFGHGQDRAHKAPRSSQPSVRQPEGGASPSQAETFPPPITGDPSLASAATVDVGEVLKTMADMKDGGGNYQTSIVDLLKLLDLDSGLAARKNLGEELGVHAGADGSAEQNIALHRAVMDKLAENGGIVPDSLRH